MLCDGEVGSHGYRDAAWDAHLFQYVLEVHYTLVCAQCCCVDLGVHFAHMKGCAGAAFFYQIISVVFVQLHSVVHLQDVFQVDGVSRAKF